mgnify:CR=1 FL=1
MKGSLWKGVRCNFGRLIVKAKEVRRFAVVLRWSMTDCGELAFNSQSS